MFDPIPLYESTPVGFVIDASGLSEIVNTNVNNTHVTQIPSVNTEQ